MTKIMKGGVAYNSTSNIVALTQAEYNALSTAQKNNGNFYCITDADPSYFSAENIDYDNTDSGLSAINIQDAIDEVADVKGEVTQINKTDNETYSLLLATDNTTTTDTGNVYKSSFLKYNPSTQKLSLSSSGAPSVNSVEINPTGGGHILAKNISTTYPSKASLTADAGGGHISATTPSGISCVSLDGTSTGGVITVTDHNRTENIVLTGSTGNITCSTINSKTPMNIGTSGYNTQEFINQCKFNMAYTGSLNDAPTYGISFVSGTGLSNSPSSGYVFCISVSQNGNRAYVNQLAFVLGTQNLYVRSSNNGNWSAWRTI